MRHRSASLQKSGGFHRVGNVGTALLPECLRDGAVVLAFRERQPAFILSDPRHFLAARILVAQVGNAAGISHERVDDMRVLPAILQMKDTATLVFPEVEFGFIMAEKNADDLGWILGVGRRVYMNMMDRTIRPAMCGVCNKFRDLALEVFGRESARRHHKHLLAIFRFEQMTGESGAACTSRCSRNHFDAASAARSRFTRPTISAFTVRRSRISASKSSCSGRRPVSR
nr:hypothetical protein [Bradyrhizobium sp. SZCCHNPS2010]